MIAWHRAGCCHPVGKRKNSDLVAPTNTRCLAEKVRGKSPLPPPNQGVTHASVQVGDERRFRAIQRTDASVDYWDGEA